MRDTLNIVADGLEQHRLRHGEYPELPDFASMVGPASPLVTESLVPPHIPLLDPWGRPFEGVSTRSRYRLRSLGDPRQPNEWPEWEVTSDHPRS